MRALILAVAISALAPCPACRSIDTATVPVVVKVAIFTRAVSLAALERDLASGLGNARVGLVLEEDHAAWQLLRHELDRVQTGADLKAVLQSQEIAVGVAIERLAAGQFTTEQSLGFVRALLATWQSLENYYGSAR